MRFAPLLADDRAVSTTVGYTMAIGVTIVLVSGLLVSVGGLVDDGTDRAIEAELETVAEGIATELATLETVADRDSPTTVGTRIDAPVTIVGESYQIALETDCASVSAPACLRVSTGGRAHFIGLSLESVDSTTVDGGTIWLVATDGTVALAEVRPR